MLDWMRLFKERCGVVDYPSFPLSFCMDAYPYRKTRVTVQKQQQRTLRILTGRKEIRRGSLPPITSIHSAEMLERGAISRLQATR